jgi:hypothetical protein
MRSFPGFTRRKPAEPLWQVANRMIEGSLIDWLLEDFASWERRISNNT